MSVRPKDRFSKESHQWYKRLRKIVKGLPARESVIFIVGRTYGSNYPHVVVLVDGLPVDRHYFYGRPKKKEVKELLGEFLCQSTHSG